MTPPLVRIAILGLSAVVLTSYVLNPPGRQKLRAVHGSVNGDAAAAITAETFPICSAMGLSADSGDWAAHDPDFVNGKRAMAAGDWHGAIRALTMAGLRDDRNADIQNYLGYAYRRLGQFDAAMQHYKRALVANPRHRGAHAHLGEAYLLQGELAEAESRLAALERICLIPCAEYEELKWEIAQYSK